MFNILILSISVQVRIFSPKKNYEIASFWKIFFKIAINLVKYGTLTGSLWRLRNESQKMDGNEWQSSQSKAGPIRPLSVTGVGARLRNCLSLAALDSIQRHCRGCTCFQAPGHRKLPPQPWWSLSPCFLALWDVNPVLRGHSWLS